MSIEADMDLFTPVNYLNHNNFLSSLETAAGKYFYYGQPQAYVLNAKNNSYEVVLLTCKTKPWLTAVKIASLFTGVIPAFMLLVLAASRYGKKFSQSGHSPNSILITREKTAPLNQTYRYQKIFEKAGIDINEATALQKHIVFFADDEGNLTRASIQNGFERLNLGKIKSYITSWLVFRGIASATGSTTQIVSMKKIALANHASDTGIFDKEGKIDPKKFEALKKYAKIDPSLLTAEEFAQIRLDNKNRDRNVSGKTTGALASKGEFDLTLSLFSDRVVVDEYGDVSFALSFDRIQELYTDGPRLFEEAAQEIGMKAVTPILVE